MESKMLNPGPLYVFGADMRSDGASGVLAMQTASLQDTVVAAFIKLHPNAFSVLMNVLGEDLGHIRRRENVKDQSARLRAMLDGLDDNGRMFLAELFRAMTVARMDGQEPSMDSEDRRLPQRPAS